MSKRFYNRLTPELFAILLEGGRFKKIPSTEGMYINRKAEILAIKTADAKQIAYIYTNTSDHPITAKNNSGYLIMNVEGKTRTVHSLVAEAFLGPRPEGYDIDHIDGNKTNNTAENLRYVTHTENMRSFYAQPGTRKKPAPARGRYIYKTQTFIAPTGERVKIPFDKYLLFLEKEYGKAYAHKIKRNHTKREV